MAEHSSAPKRRRRHTLVKEDRICQVCGDSATNYNFGVLSCEACKAFFRRNASQNSSIKCAFNEMCLSMTSKNTRRRCSACRLKLCFEKGMTCDFLKQKSNAANSTSSDSDSLQASCSGFHSLEAAGPVMLAYADPLEVNLEHYKALADLEADLHLSSAHLLEIEALGRVLAEAVGEAGWTATGPVALHFPSALEVGRVSWPSLLRYADTVVCRLHTFLQRYGDLSSWNLSTFLLPAIKKRLLSILIPLHLPSYYSADCSFHTVIDGLRVSVNPRQLQQWIHQHKPHIASYECLAHLVDYVEKLHALLGNDRELCALFTCVKLFLRHDPTSVVVGDAVVGCSSGSSNSGSSNSSSSDLDDALPSRLTAEFFERFESHLFELCALLSLKHPEDFGERFKLLLNLLSWSQTFDHSLAALMNSVMLGGSGAADNR